MTLLNELMFREIDLPDLIPDVIPEERKPSRPPAEPDIEFEDESIPISLNHFFFFQNFVNEAIRNTNNLGKNWYPLIQFT